MVTKILKFSASYCGPCQALKRNLKDINFPVEEIDIQENTDLAAEYEIRSIPTLIYIDENGKTLHRSVGLVTKDAVLAKIEELNETSGD